MQDNRSRARIGRVLRGASAVGLKGGRDFLVASAAVALALTLFIGGQWLYITLTNPGIEDIQPPLHGFLLAASTGDAVNASRFSYYDPIAYEAGLTRRTARYDAPALKAYRDVAVSHFFTDRAHVDLLGTVLFDDGASRRFRAAMHKGIGGWGVVVFEFAD